MVQPRRYRPSHLVMLVVTFVASVPWQSRQHENWLPVIAPSNKGEGVAGIVACTSNRNHGADTAVLIAHPLLGVAVPERVMLLSAAPPEEAAGSETIHQSLCMRTQVTIRR